MAPEKTSLPLYAGCEKPSFKASGNTGLWYDKFCDAWERFGTNRWSMSALDGGSNPKTKWIGSVVGKSCGDRELIEETARRIGHLTRAAGGRCGIFKTTGRFVTGLGRAHPVENGFAWHPTLGTPYLPGSSVKGMVRAWAAEELGSTDHPDIHRIFGGRNRVGAVCFLDAVPRKAVPLEEDVITPHAAGWNEKDLPGDWRSPTPIPFLVTAEGAAFVFAVLPRPGATEEDLDRVWRWLSEALAFAGAGAKTAVGYGRFEPVDEKGGPCGGTEPPPPPPKMTEEEALREIRRYMEGKKADPAELRELLDTIFAEGWHDRWKRGKKADPNTQLGGKKLKERGKWVVEQRGELEGSEGK